MIKKIWIEIDELGINVFDRANYENNTAIAAIKTVYLCDECAQS